jgi:hypothetical protein
MMKRLSSLMTLAGLLLAILLLAASPAEAARTCGYGWAVPGTYKVSGDFRGTTESASAKLTNDCRVILQIPGVFSGGGVSRSGGCLLFRFKVEGEAGVFTARWCDSYGIVPWQGRNIRAAVTRIEREPAPVQRKQNFNIQ